MPGGAAAVPGPLAVDFDQVRAAAGRLRGVAHLTPALVSSQANRRTGATAFFKAENLQRVGAFKFRGAYNALSLLDPARRSRGVITYSSGNHAQAVALAGQLLGSPATIVMPTDAPAVKLAATRGYGARVVLYDRLREDRETVATALARRDGLTLIPPFDHADVVAGQGTCALELFEQVGPLDFLFVCVGGGGLLSGCAVAAAALSPGCRVIGVEPAAGDDAVRSFHSGTLQHCENPATIADGARTHSLGRITFPLVLRYVHELFSVTDEELLLAMQFLWERMKLVVEPTGALATAGLFQARVDVAGARVGVILSGGNVDVTDFFARFPRAGPQG